MKFLPRAIAAALLFCPLATLASPAAEPATERQPVALPPAIRDQFLADMRDHLTEISQIHAALADGAFNRAADIAEQRLGFAAPSSAACRMPGMALAHTAPDQHLDRMMDNSEMTKFMPKEMHMVGYRMHTAADRFAQTARKAAATSDYRSALYALSKVTQQCVACHTQFKLAKR